MWFLCRILVVSSSLGKIVLVHTHNSNMAVLDSPFPNQADIKLSALSATRALLLHGSMACLVDVEACCILATAQLGFVPHTVSPVGGGCAVLVSTKPELVDTQKSRAEEARLEVHHHYSWPSAQPQP